MNRRFAVVCVGLALSFAAGQARAEVSVRLDADGQFKRMVILTRSAGRPVVWAQVRARLPLEQILNPLGDTYGDLAPSIALNPITGNPWAVWPHNEGNQKRLMVSYWTGARWSDPVALGGVDAMGDDQVEPRLVFDASGAPFVLYTEAARPARILVRVLEGGQWSRTIRLSAASADSRAPVASIAGDALSVGWTTPVGPVTKVLSASAVKLEGFSLMDNPIPPGASPPSPVPKNPGMPGDDPGEQFIIRH